MVVKNSTEVKQADLQLISLDTRIVRVLSGTNYVSGLFIQGFGVRVGLTTFGASKCRHKYHEAIER